MKNKTLYTVLGLLLLAALVVFLMPSKKVETPTASAKNATYIIEGQPVTLVDGVFVAPQAPGSSTSFVTQYFGNEITHDFDHDGRLDTAFILTQTTGGSGTFYYVVAALNTANGYVGSDAVLLGDRIAPQTIEMSQKPTTPDVIIVNYADRKPEEPFTTQPSVGKSIWLKLDIETVRFGEVAQNFEGESNLPNAQPSTFTWKTKLDTALNPDGLPKTKVSLDVTYSDGSVQNKFVDTPDGSCNSLDEAAPDAVASTTVLQCYAAGFGYKYKIVKAVKTYQVMRQEFEEGSPEYNPPVQPYKMIAEF